MLGAAFSAKEGAAAASAMRIAGYQFCRTFVIFLLLFQVACAARNRQRLYCACTGDVTGLRAVFHRFTWADSDVRLGDERDARPPSAGGVEKGRSVEPITTRVGVMRAGVLRFGAYQVDRQTGELSDNGRKVKLQVQPFQVLVALLERPGEVVTREDLRQKLWPGDTFVDFDNSVNIAVRKLRQALNDDATQPRFIETLPKRGLPLYRCGGAARRGGRGGAEIGR